MHIDHVHFYVEDARVWRDWFIQTLGCQSLATGTSSHTYTEIVGLGEIYFALSAALTDNSPVAQYLRLHPPGIVDLAFKVTDLKVVLNRAIAHGAKLLQPLQITTQQQESLKWAQISGWGGLRHTLVESTDFAALLPILAHAGADLSDLVWVKAASVSRRDRVDAVTFVAIDHAVLNVMSGDLERAVSWYEKTLGFQRQQSFVIQTEYSALGSQVLTHPDGTVQMPINEPASASSQIQEFLDINRGSGVQHLAIQSLDVVRTIAQLRQKGLTFLPVPATYYSQLRQRPGFCLTETLWSAIAHQEVLVDWREDRPQALLLQAFTQPIFDQPTFFFELIERQQYRVNQDYHQAQGFGEGNFRALFEAIEREQIKRGSLL
jgi:4-hydroxyphenylpyruvate dioxygenase